MGSRVLLALVLAVGLSILSPAKCASIGKQSSTSGTPIASVGGSQTTTVSSDNEKAFYSQPSKENIPSPIYIAAKAAGEKQSTFSTDRERDSHPYLEKKRASTSTETPTVLEASTKSAVVNRAPLISGDNKTGKDALSPTSGTQNIAKDSERNTSNPVTMSNVGNASLSQGKKMLATTTKPVTSSIVKRSTSNDDKSAEKKSHDRATQAGVDDIMAIHSVASFQSDNQAAVSRPSKVPQSHNSKRTWPSTSIQKLAASTTPTSGKSGLVKGSSTTEKNIPLAGSSAELHVSSHCKNSKPSSGIEEDHQSQTSTSTNTGKLDSRKSDKPKVRRSAENIKMETHTSSSLSSTSPTEEKNQEGKIKSEKSVHSPLDDKSTTSSNAPRIDTTRAGNATVKHADTNSTALGSSTDRSNPAVHAEGSTANSGTSKLQRQTSEEKFQNSEVLFPTNKPTTSSNANTMSRPANKGTLTNVQKQTSVAKADIVKRSTELSEDIQNGQNAHSEGSSSSIKSSTLENMSVPNNTEVLNVEKSPLARRRVPPIPLVICGKNSTLAGKIPTVQQSTQDDFVKRAVSRSTRSPAVLRKPVSSISRSDNSTDASKIRQMPKSNLIKKQLPLVDTTSASRNKRNTQSTLAPLKSTSTSITDTVPTSTRAQTLSKVAQKVVSTSRTPIPTGTTSKQPETSALTPEGNGSQRSKRATSDTDTVTTSSPVHSPSSSPNSGKAEGSLPGLQSSTPSEVTKAVVSSSTVTTPSTHIGKVRPISQRPSTEETPQCEPFCTSNYQPVCAGDGVAAPMTFHNECQLRLFNCRNRENLTIASMSKC